ncbi:MAG: transcriptional regulator [Candidatus Goldiibacteriota bacterium HGW-Goldbacteria-1]|jgi:nitrogen regulatory protein P-II 1|nr:MAG: transcriptional regulator [Candidatus Goldiibacteriota bacterium HGW-Goldbacteria-1]
MKKITVIIAPSKFDALRKRMIETGVCGLTVTAADGFGVQKSKLEKMRDQDIAVEFLPKSKVEMVVKDSEAEMVIKEIVDCTRTGRIGDGKIFISEITDVLRIRTGERKEDAI